ncbi:peptidyl-prolyl cis-trans isomerase G isoform X3 [Temnothorax curvispinosus]|uniref:Peptidyl-prolyl cis-trans isomerase G isoform X3 n=1 Tax=Temnothorax curvispinosus TaxID=300111 RepID=A0A6J1PRX5_9HYME|nr:peptidyl-prolyl cis-trans isomerase G isoform X3 [Temnothorax curvispinosus]
MTNESSGSFCSSLIPLIIFCCCSTTQPAPHLDNVHVVFGEVVSGQEIVTHIEGLPVDRMSRPLQDAKVVNCGELILKIKSKVKKREAKQSSSAESESDSYSADKAKKKKKSKKSKKRAKSEDGEIRDSNEEDDGEPHPLVSVTKIDPDEIPEVPANKFLYRAGSTNNANQKEFRQHYGRDRVRSHRKTGRVFKGRGIFRYHTPSRSRSRSTTPPHWKQAQNRTIKLHEFQKIEKERMKKEEDFKQRETDRGKRFADNPDENDQVPDLDNNICPTELMENKENDQTDETAAIAKVAQDDSVKRNTEGNNVMQSKEMKHNKNEKFRRDANRSYNDRNSRRDSKDRNRRRGRSRSRDRRRSRERDYDRRGSRDRRNRRNYSPRRRDSYRTNRPGRDNYRHYDKRNDRRRNNSNSHQDNDINSRHDKTKYKKNDNVSDTSQAKFKRRSRSSSSSSQHSKD